MELIYKFVVCHLLGDYVLQIDFISKTKADNNYHLLVHCLLYTLPFYIITGLDWRLIVLFIIHIIIDYRKCKGKIDYVADQICHYCVIIMVYLINWQELNI